MYIPNIGDYLRILTDDEVQDFVTINFSEYFKSTKEELYSKLNEEQNLRKVTRLFSRKQKRFVIHYFEHATEMLIPSSRFKRS